MPEIPRVSVVMAVRNGGPYLEKAVDSILAQTFTDFEFVIIDDGSTDSTPQVLQRYQAADRRVLVHHQENVGLTVSLNRGCGRARGAYLARMDADDIAFGDRLERQVGFLDRHPRVALVGSPVVRIDESGREIKRSGGPGSHAEIVRALAEYNCFTHPTVMLRKDMLAAVGGYREAYRQAQDYDLWLRLAERYELANLADPLLYYRVYADQVSVRHLEQQIVSVVGARAAARERAATGRDPTPARGYITAGLLREWGVPDATVAKAMGEGFHYAAYVMQQAGCQREAIEVLREGRRLSKGVKSGLEAQLAGACWQQARIDYQAGRFWAAVSWSLQAWQAQPMPPLRLFRRPRAGTRPETDGSGATL
jgi:glycosyltransferase involved in cell wall biosynthesis